MSVEEWLGEAPAEVAKTTERLLGEVAGMRANGQTIYPPQDDILNALAWTAPGDVRAVILGQDPYHEEGQAMGLSFSVHEGCRLPPSLRNIYKEMTADLGCGTPASGDLSGWARQGVLLLNTVLTVPAGRANAHRDLGWQHFTDAVISACGTLPQPVAFVLWGSQAQKKELHNLKLSRTQKLRKENAGSHGNSQHRKLTENKRKRFRADHFFPS